MGEAVQPEKTAYLFEFTAAFQSTNLSLYNEDSFGKPSLGSNSTYCPVLELLVSLSPSLTHTVSSLRPGPAQLIYGA